MALIPYAPADKPGADHPMNLFRMLAHSRPMFDGVARLGGAILMESSLAPRLREIAILRVGHLLDASYELTKHTSIARGLDFSEADLAELVPGGPGGALSPFERRVVEFTDEVAQSGRAREETLRAVRAELADGGLVELVVTIGYYGLICRFLETLSIDEERGK